MGLNSSKHVETGSLKGAYAPPIASVPLPEPLEPAKEFKVTVPYDKREGDTMVVAMRGQEMVIRIPKGKKPGDVFFVRSPAQTSKVISSTLPTIPGMVTIQSKPIIWSTVSFAYYRNNFNDQSEQSSMARTVAGLLQEAQEGLLRKAIEVECNAVLGMTINITTDSSGERGNSKIVIVTVCGTPCVTVPSAEIPAVSVDAVVEPLYV